LKTINYRGGLISFEIPKHWVEEFEESGGGTFFEDTPNSGTLRVNVLTIKAKEDKENPLKTLKNGNEKIDQKEYTTAGGNDILEYLIRTKEKETPITVFTLLCAHKTNNQEYLVAVFTWTIETKFETQEKYIQEWNSIRTQIQNVKFGG